MRKLLAFLISACAVAAVAQTAPPIIGYMKNRAAGQIVLTSEICTGSTNQQFAYIKDDGGKMSMTGCWQLIDNEIFMRWSDGDVYIYEAERVIFTPEFQAWFKNRSSSNGKPL